jgi:Uncharacterized protein conserved in bacteria
MSLINKMSTFFGLEDDNYMEDTPIETTQVNHQPVQKVAKQPIKQPVQPKVKVQPVAQQPKVSPAQPKEPAKSKNIFKPRTAKQPMIDHQSTAVRKPQIEQEEHIPQIQPEPKIVAMQQSTPRTNRGSQTVASASKILIVEPRVYSEAMTIAKHVMSGESVLVNFHLIEEYQARRIVDFLTGTVYAEDGDIKRVADEIFLCTPKGTEIDGTAKSLIDTNMFDL